MQDEVDALFKLPLGEFTPARNALAARLEKAGQPAIAAAAKAVPKPSVAAWVVNQLYWRHRGSFDRLIEAGDRFRQAQSAQQSRNSADVREHLEARREAQAALVRIAVDVLRGGGYSGTRDMLRRVTSTLEALSTYGSLPDAPRAGRLTAELEPPGFEMAAVLLPLSGKKGREAAETRTAAARPRAEPALKPTHRKGALEAAASREKERRRLAASAKAAVREAERALRAARTKAKRTAATSEIAATRAKDSERRRAKIEKQLAKVVTAGYAARERVRQAEANAQQAARAAESAEGALELARDRVEQLAVNRG